MNTKELISTVASKMNYPKSEIQFLLDRFSELCINRLTNDDAIEFQNFGTFEVTKKDEKESIDLEKNVKILYPPKLVISFNQSDALESKLNLQ
jgi:nucleoid DNA-binding protein